MAVERLTEPLVRRWVQQVVQTCTFIFVDFGSGPSLACSVRRSQAMGVRLMAHAVDAPRLRPEAARQAGARL